MSWPCFAAIDDVQEQPLVAALQCHGHEQADVCRTRHQALRIPWGALQVSDPSVAGMVRVDREVHRAVQLLIGSYVTKSFPLHKGATGLDLEGCDRNGAPPEAGVRIVVCGWAHDRRNDSR